MENASKALLMAGTIMISLFIMGIFVYLFRAGGSLGETYDNKQLAEQLELYNSKFENYNKDDNTIMDLISLFNLAYSVNETSEYDPQDAVSITVIAGSRKYSIKNTKGITADDTLVKNQVYSNGAKISVYDLVSKTIGDLRISTNDSYKNDKLSVIKSVQVVQEENIYRYTFKCTKIEYNDYGKVSNMEFQLYGFSDVDWNSFDNWNSNNEGLKKFEECFDRKEKI